MNILHLFYEEPEIDRWFRGDLWFRKIARRIIRGPSPIGGVQRWFVNLRDGLDKLGVKFVVNDYVSLRNCPGATAYVIGKPHVLTKIPQGHPIVFGPGVASHPSITPEIYSLNVRLLIIPCDWFREMYTKVLETPIPTVVWPAGIDTELWAPQTSAERRRFVVYDKIRWNRTEYEETLLKPILTKLKDEDIPVSYIKYGSYREKDYHDLLSSAQAMIFLCEHETQGFAYMQALSAGVPIFAWNRRGKLIDPSVYPSLVDFEPVNSVPYFNESCGMEFIDYVQFENRFELFKTSVNSGRFNPRAFIVENFGLAKQARAFMDIASKFESQVSQGLPIDHKPSLLQAPSPAISTRGLRGNR